MRICQYCNNQLYGLSKKSVCNDCKKQQEQNRVGRDTDKLIEQLKAKGYTKGLESVKNLRAKIWRIKQKYNLEFEIYLQLIETQGEVCAICKQSKKLVVDHCHTTGKVRGLLCNSCNSGLGQFQDNTGYLISAADYLKQ